MQNEIWSDYKLFFYRKYNSSMYISILQYICKENLFLFIIFIKDWYAYYILESKLLYMLHVILVGLSKFYRNKCRTLSVWWRDGFIRIFRLASTLFSSSLQGGSNTAGLTWPNLK